jgi:hypothetical protein
MKDFLLSYFQYSQIWLDILMDDCHLIAMSQNWGEKKLDTMVLNRVWLPLETAIEPQWFSGQVFWIHNCDYSKIKDSVLVYNHSCHLKIKTNNQL